MRTEHPKYFEALDVHPRALVGKEVPSATGEGTEVLRDAADAREWQDATKQLLVSEIRSRASKASDENAQFAQTVHASIALFQNNADLIPGTKTFDVDLANRFAELAKPYELRVEGKLQGYSIQVQPLIDHLRSQLGAERQAAAARPPAPAAASAAAGSSTTGSAQPPAAGQGSATPDQPQAGIPSKAGESGTGGEDFSTLFGTLGLPDLRI